MTDEKLLKVTKELHKANRASRRNGYPPGAELAVGEEFFSGMHQSRNALSMTKRFLSSMNEKDLNELRIVIAISNYCRMDKARGLKARAEIPLRDLQAWQNHLEIKSMSRAECVADLMKRSGSCLIGDIEKYLEMKPMSKTRRGFINIIKAKQHLQCH